ncbi:MAG: DNA-deoxyinosine glycosylase [Clostridiales Family XIII bacterium]|jgi:hypoxanthine-DNA glycosylase|nr:DNA-deoxyinosine glycosylase [Clostridiales Family XIII bacterium]
MKLIHPWPPLFDKNSKVLILGTIPSPKSREMGFFYGHPQNIFWKTLAQVLNQPEPDSNVNARRAFLLENRIALWDVLHACEIEGASDASIRNPEPNRFRTLLEKTQIQTIFTTGKSATNLFNTLCAEEVGTSAIYLPSTSPANRATQKRPEFYEQWKKVAEALDKKTKEHI